MIAHYPDFYMYASIHTRTHTGMGEKELRGREKERSPATSVLPTLQSVHWSHVYCSDRIYVQRHPIHEWNFDIIEVSISWDQKDNSENCVWWLCRGCVLRNSGPQTLFLANVLLAMHDSDSHACLSVSHRPLLVLDGTPCCFSFQANYINSGPTHLPVPCCLSFALRNKSLVTNSTL